MGHYRAHHPGQPGSQQFPVPARPSMYLDSPSSKSSAQTQPRTIRQENHSALARLHPGEDQISTTPMTRAFLRPIGRAAENTIAGYTTVGLSPRMEGFVLYLGGREPKGMMETRAWETAVHRQQKKQSSRHQQRGTRRGPCTGRICGMPEAETSPTCGAHEPSRPGNTAPQEGWKIPPPNQRRDPLSHSRQAVGMGVESTGQGPLCALHI